MSEEKKTPSKKTATKKNVDKKATESKQPIKVQETTPKRVKRVEIDRNEMVPVRSVTKGILVYISERTKARYFWHDYDVVQYIDMGELLDMRGHSPKYLNEVQVVIDDEEVAEYLGLTRKYEALVGLENLDDFFMQDNDTLSEIIPKLPKGIKTTLANHARSMVEDQRLDRLNTIELLERKEMLNASLSIFRKS